MANNNIIMNGIHAAKQKRKKGRVFGFVHNFRNNKRAVT